MITSQENGTFAAGIWISGIGLLALTGVAVFERAQEVRDNGG